MGWWRRKQQPPNRAGLMSAVAVPNPAIEALPREDGSLELRVPIPKTRLARWVSGNDRPVVRRFELDRLGAAAWRMVDGTKSVRRLIEEFAAEQQLNLREAEVAMLTYLRTLSARGIMMLAVPQSAESVAHARSPEQNT